MRIMSGASLCGYPQRTCAAFCFGLLFKCTIVHLRTYALAQILSQYRLDLKIGAEPALGTRLRIKDMQPVIIHLDMNSYFASVEQQDNPGLRGKVLGVCEHLGGIIIAASIEAKKWGIKTGTPVWEAKKIYPKIILMPTRPEAYRKYNRLMVKVVSDYTDRVEVYSIDEVFFDITKACNIRGTRDKGQGAREYYQKNPFEEAVKIAQTIKRRMKREVGGYLTCSIGIAENKLLAKIGSDLKKPDGIVVITSDAHKDDPCAVQGSSLLWLSKADLYQRLKLIDIPGIGRRMEKRLNALGIRTLLDLKNYSESRLAAAFGILGRHLYQMGQLESGWKPGVAQDEEINPHTKPGSGVGIKSIGHMYTLPKEYRRREFFAPVLYKLCEMVARRLRRQELMGRVLHFYLAGCNGQGFGQSRRLKFCLYDGREIFLQCMQIFEGWKVPAGGFKLIGVTAAGLVPYSRQLSLFGREEKTRGLEEALDKINSKYGEFTVCRVPVLRAGRVFRDSVGFGRIKENLR